MLGQVEMDKLKRAAPYIGIPVLAGLYFALQTGKTDPFTVLQYEFLLMFGYIAAIGDLKNKRIPNRLVLAMLAVWALTMMPKLFLDTGTAILLLRDSAFGFLTGGGLFLLIYLISRKGLGGGDVKFMAAAGLYLGFSHVVPAMLYGALLSGFTALILLAFKKIGLKDSIPLAPFLYVGIALIIFFA